MQLISIIVPCYNAEKYIRDCIDSVCLQTYSNWEIVAIDDGSTDNTLSILHSYIPILNDKIVVRSIQNSGASKARNIGLEIAKGDIIQFLDADDVLNSQKFEMQLKGFHKDIDCVVSDWISMDENLNKELKTVKLDHIVDNPLQVAITKVIITGNPLYKTSIVKKIGGYDESLTSAQDWEFHIRMVLQGGKFNYVPGVFFRHRDVKGSISSSWIKVSIQACKILGIIENKLRQHPLLNETTKSYICQLYWDSAIYSKNMSESNDFLRKLKMWGGDDYSFISNKLKRILVQIFGLRSIVRLLKLKNAYFILS